MGFPFGRRLIPSLTSLCPVFYFVTLSSRLTREEFEVPIGLVSLKEQVAFETFVQLHIKIESLLISIFLFLLGLRSEDSVDAQENSSTEAGNPPRFGSATLQGQWGLALPSPGSSWYRELRFDALDGLSYFLLFCFFFLLAMLHSMWDLSSPTRDRTRPPALEGGVLTPGPPEKSSYFLLSRCLGCRTANHGQIES